jgi:23S rRNA (uracil1939-C5)-methyltransferase
MFLEQSSGAVATRPLIFSLNKDMKTTRNETITIKAEHPIYGGLAIGRRDGKVVMIKGAIPGETVEARIDQDKKDYSTATAIKVLDPSPDRVEPRSRYFGDCGGCQLQHIAYGRQVRIKEEVLESALRRTGGIAVSLAEPLVGNPWNYRYRGQFKISHGGTGFFREKSRDVVDIERCSLMKEEINGCYSKARELLRDVDAKGMDISCGSGEVVALIKGARGDRAGLDELADSFIRIGFSGIFILLEGGKLLKYGKEYITLDLSGLKYTVSPMSFFQSNWELDQALVKLVVERLGPLHGKTVLDLYSGAGNFSLPLAQHAERVLAVEENPFAVEDGVRNAEINGINNCEFRRGDAGSLEDLKAVDIVVADPPRTGLTGSAVDKILGLGPGQVVYVSCDPMTLARDLKKLSGMYAVTSFRLVDFFPQTYHIEAVALLGRR